MVKNYTGVTLVRPITPVGYETIHHWSVGEIVRFCLAFVGPEESFEQASKEGLSELLVMEVRERPVEFSANAMEFVALGHDDSL